MNTHSNAVSYVHGVVRWRTRREVAVDGGADRISAAGDDFRRDEVQGGSMRAIIARSIINLKNTPKKFIDITIVSLRNIYTTQTRCRWTEECGMASRRLGKWIDADGGHNTYQKG